MTWKKTTTPPALTVFQRLQILMLRLERIAVAEQTQRTDAVIRGLMPPEDKP